MNEIEKLARSVVYRCLYDALQYILKGGASKEQAEKILIESCREVISSNNTTYFFE
jgi:hypothetical protein